MNDRGSRELERQLGGDPQVEAALLARELRHGQRDPERLALAAYLGHQPAQAALGDDSPRAPETLETYVRGLERWGPEAWVRAALGCARLALAAWEERHEDPRPREALEAVAAWISAPAPERAAAAEIAGEACYEILAEVEEIPVRKGHSRSPSEENALAFRETRACALAALCATTPGSQGVRTALLSVVAARERLALGEVGFGPGGQSLFRRAAGVDRLGHMPELNTSASALAARQAIAQGLIAYALER